MAGERVVVIGEGSSIVHEHTRKSPLAQAVQPEPAEATEPGGSAVTTLLPSDTATDSAAILAAHLFAQGDRDIAGVSYAVGYRLADMHCGGDIVDVYRFDNGAVALAIADISGKGTVAAIHAALIKYGLRAYASHGLTPETVMRAMDRLYLENCTFENVESFATVFFGIVDPRRRLMTYSSAGHEAVVIVQPHFKPEALEPTSPLIGVFDDQHHLFRQETIELWPGSLLIATTDGITEARNARGELFGIDRLMAVAEASRNGEPAEIIDAIVSETERFSGSPWQDDVAVLVARFS